MIKNSIIAVDDNLFFLERVSNLMREAGYDVDTAKSGKEAFEKCIQKLYALILIDINLPDYGCMKLLSRIRDTNFNIYKVIITGYPDIENVRQAYKLGTNAYLTKPVDVEELLRTVRTCF